MGFPNGLSPRRQPHAPRGLHGSVWPGMNQYQAARVPTSRRRPSTTSSYKKDNPDLRLRHFRSRCAIATPRRIYDRWAAIDGHRPCQSAFSLNHHGKHSGSPVPCTSGELVRHQLRPDMAFDDERQWRSTICRNIAVDMHICIRRGPPQRLAGYLLQEMKLKIKAAGGHPQGDPARPFGEFWSFRVKIFARS